MYNPEKLYKWELVTIGGMKKQTYGSILAAFSVSFTSLRPYATRSFQRQSYLPHYAES